MKVHLERDWRSTDWRIWLYEHAGTKTCVGRLEPDGSFKHEVIERSAEIGDPSFTLSSEALESLVREASQVLPASDATVEHLKDAVAVRDRLLTLVESGFGA